MKRFTWPVITLVIILFVTAFLLAQFPAGESYASVLKPKPTPSPRPSPTPSPTPVSSGGVNFQTNGNLNPGDTFCLPVQSVEHTLK